MPIHYLRDQGGAVIAGGGTQLADQAGNSGKYLTTDGTVTSWSAVTSVGTLSGLSLSGNLVATTSLSFKGADNSGSTLTVIGGSGSTAYSGAPGGGVTISGGTGNIFYDGIGGGSVTIAGGRNQGGTGGSTGGSVFINGGVAPVGGAIVLSTAPSVTLIERFRILANGAWSIGTDGTSYGSSGQVLTSNGNATPTWQWATTASTSIAGGSTGQIPFQSAANTTAFSSGLTFTSASNTLSVGPTASSEAAVVAGGDYGAGGTQPGIGLTLRAGNGGTGDGGYNTGATLALVSGTGGAGGPGGIITLSTGGGTPGTRTERFRISSDGAWGLAGPNYGTSGQVLTSNGSAGAPTWQSGNGLFPTQTGNSGKYLTTDGTNASWGPAISATLANAVTLGTSSAAVSITGYANAPMSISPGGIGGAGANLTLSGGSTGSTDLGGNLILNGGGGNLRGGLIILQTCIGTTPVERLRIGNEGGWGLSGANYGSTGQVLTSNGSQPPTWTTIVVSSLASTTTLGTTANTAVSITGLASTSGASNPMTIRPGTSAAGSSGNTMTVAGGAGNGVNGGGAITIRSGDTASSGGTAGTVTVHADSISIGGAVTVRGGDAAGNSSAGGAVTLRGGDSTNGSTSGAGGAVTIRGGNAAATTAGGSVTISGGTGPAGGGQLVFQTGATTSLSERLRITKDGAWGLGGANYGTSGQVLTSNGNAAPTWQTPAGGGTVSTGIISGTDSTSGSALTVRGGNGSAGTGGDLNLYGGTGTSTPGNVLIQTAGGAGLPLATRMTFSGNTGEIQFNSAYNESISATVASSTTTIDCSLGNNFDITMSTSILSLAFTNIPAARRMYFCTLIFIQDAVGNKTIAWPASIRWQGGSEPALTATPNKIDMVTLVTYDGGASWLGVIAGQNF